MLLMLRMFRPVLSLDAEGVYSQGHALVEGWSHSDFSQVATAPRADLCAVSSRFPSTMEYYPSETEAARPQPSIQRKRQDMADEIQYTVYGVLDIVW